MLKHQFYGIKYVLSVLVQDELLLIWKDSEMDLCFPFYICRRIAVILYFENTALGIVK